MVSHTLRTHSRTVTETIARELVIFFAMRVDRTMTLYRNLSTSDMTNVFLKYIYIYILGRMSGQFVYDLTARMQFLKIYVHIVAENTKLC